MVIDGRVRARLLGLHLLEIDTHIVVSTARPYRAVATPRRGDGSTRPLTSDGSGQPPLRRAVRLLAEGTSTLDDARRIRLGEPSG